LTSSRKLTGEWYHYIITAPLNNSLIVWIYITAQMRVQLDAEEDRFREYC
jgi:hypothetical protein